MYAAITPSTKVASVTGYNATLTPGISLTIPASSSESGLGQCIVIDKITFGEVLTAATTKTFVISVLDANSGIIWAGKLTQTGPVPWSFHADFYHGLPCWTMASGASDTGQQPGAITVQVGGASQGGGGVDATAELTVVYHYSRTSEIME